MKFETIMNDPDEKFRNIQDQLKKGVVPAQETVRSFLGWFGFERRGWKVTREIRSSLEKNGLRTEPDFEDAYIDLAIIFVPDSQQTGDTRLTPPDPSHRIGRLVAANRPPLSVKPGHELSSIVTLMLANNYSQLPVMTTTREVKGIVSWQSIGSRLALGQTCKTAQDCMEQAVVVGTDEPLFSAISLIAKNDFILVRGGDQQITGIVTASDLNDQFVILAEPFLLVGEIENTLRRMLHGKFTVEELKVAKHSEDTERRVEAVADLTFGEYIRLIENDANWQRLSIAVDRVEFINRLSKVKEIRNDVMHFDPDGIEEADIAVLRVFAKFLKRLRDIGAV